MKLEFSGKAFLGKQLYSDFQTWVRDQDYFVAITHTKFTRDLKALYGVSNKIHRFENNIVNHAIIFPPEITSLILPKKAKDDPIKLINMYINEMKLEFSGTTMRGKQIYNDFQAWMHTHNHDAICSRMKFIRELKSSFGVQTKVQREGNDVDHDILFPKNDNIMSTFISKYIQVTEQRDDLLSVDDAFELFRTSTMYNGRPKRWFTDKLTSSGYESKKCNNRNGPIPRGVYVP